YRTFNQPCRLGVLLAAGLVEGAIGVQSRPSPFHRVVPWLALAPGVLVASALASGTAPIFGKVAIVAILITTVYSPVEGFLTSVILAPLGTLIAYAFDVTGFRLTEALALAFLTGWLVRYRPRTTTSPAPPA